MPLLHQNAAKNSETKKKYKDSEDVYMQVNMLKKNSPAFRGENHFFFTQVVM